MASSIAYKENNNEYVINAEQVCYAAFHPDGGVSIQFSGGNVLKFTGMSDRDKEALRRMLRITPS